MADTVGGGGQARGTSRDRDRDRDEAQERVQNVGTISGSQRTQAERAKRQRDRDEAKRQDIQRAEKARQASIAKSRKPLTQEERVKAVSTLRINREEIKRELEREFGERTQEQRVKDVGTTEVPLRQTKPPYDFGSVLGVAEFVNDFTSPVSAVGGFVKTLNFNRKRQGAIRDKIMNDFNVTESQAQDIMDRNRLNVNDLFESARTQDFSDTKTETLRTQNQLFGPSTLRTTTGAAAAGTGGDLLGDLTARLRGGGPLAKSALESVKQQQEQLKQVEDLVREFREAGLGALPQLQALAAGGEIDFQPSELFKRQLETGISGVKRQQLAADKFKSSGTFGRLAGLASGLAAEDIGRFEAGQRGLLQTGLSAEELLRQAGGAITGGISGTLAGLGQGLNLAQQRAAQEAITRGQTLASGIRGLSDLALQLMR